MNEVQVGQVWPPQDTAADEPAERSEKDQELLTGQRVEIGDQTLNIAQCPACDGKHDGLQVLDYARPSPPYTHWYRCPSLGDPVPIALAMTKAGEGMELNGRACQELAAAQADGRWLVHIVRIAPDGGMQHRLILERFPRGDYPMVLKKFRELLEQDAGALQPDEMKQAQPKPLVGLLGAAPAVPMEQKIKLPDGVTVKQQG